MKANQTVQLLRNDQNLCKRARLSTPLTLCSCRHQRLLHNSFNHQAQMHLPHATTRFRARRRAKHFLTRVHVMEVTTVLLASRSSDMGINRGKTVLPRAHCRTSESLGA